MVKQFFEKKVRPIYFDKLIFKKPFTEYSSDIRFSGRKVLFSGLVLKQGVFVTKFTDYAGITRYDISHAQVSLHSAISRQYYLLLKNKATNIEYAFILAKNKYHTSLMNSLRSGLLHLPISNHYNLVKNCICDNSIPVPPVDCFNFRKVFLEAPYGKRRFQFTDADHRPGVYIIVKEGETKVRHIGLAYKNIADTLRNHFYKNDHVDYWLEPHLYRAAVIDIHLKEVRNNESLNNIIKTLENRLIQAYDPVDNIVGKIARVEVIVNNPWDAKDALEKVDWF